MYYKLDLGLIYTKYFEPYLFDSTIGLVMDQKADIRYMQKILHLIRKQIRNTVVIQIDKCSHIKTDQK